MAELLSISTQASIRGKHDHLSRFALFTSNLTFGPVLFNMGPISLTFASGLYDRMVPLATGEVRPTGIDLNFLDIHHPRDVFDRM